MTVANLQQQLAQTQEQLKEQKEDSKLSQLKLKEMEKLPLTVEKQELKMQQLVEQQLLLKE